MFVDALNSDLLLDRGVTIAIARDLLSFHYPDSRLENPYLSKETQDGSKRINALYKFYWENNINIIFDYSESPIEKIFLNAFNLYCIEARFSLLIFTFPLSSISQEVNAIIQNFRATIDVWNIFQEDTGIEDEEVFLKYIQQLEFGEEMQKMIRYHLMEQRFIYNNFYVSIQSTFDDVKIQDKNIRPDIFIWRPNKPNFKLIIECDGYQYHSDRSAFTADRARDRVLQDRGFQVLRFSGDEISRECFAKAKELRNYLLARQRELFEGEEGDIPFYFRRP